MDTIVNWNDYLPIETYPLNIGWNFTPQVQMIESNPSVGPSIRRLRSRTVIKRSTFTMHMPFMEQTTVFEPFVNNVLKGGINWFYFKNILDGIVYKSRLVYNGNSFYTCKRDGDEILISFTIEMYDEQGIT